MRLQFVIAMMLLSLNCFAQKSQSAPNNSKAPQGDPLEALLKLPQYNNFPQGPPPGADTIMIREPDDTRIHVISFGGQIIRYTESIDGYTLCLNDAGVYEYAVRGDRGNLKGCGVDARDPEQRSGTDKAILATIPRHIRYDGDYLKHLIYKQYKLDQSAYYGRQYLKYKAEKEAQEKNNTGEIKPTQEADKDKTGK